MEIYLVYYHGVVELVTLDPHQVAEYWNNANRDKIEIWKDGKLLETRA